MIPDDAFEPDRSQQPSDSAPPPPSGDPSPAPALVEWELDVQDSLPWAVEEPGAVEEEVAGEASSSRTAAKTPETTAPSASLSAPGAPSSAFSPQPSASQNPPSSSEKKCDGGSKGDSPPHPTVEQILEAMLFVGGPPLTPATAASAIRGLTEERFHQALHALNRRYRRQKRPYAIVPREDGFVLTLLPAYQHLRERLYGGPRTVRLSQAALDVLAIVAYRQPLTKAEVDALRGQESGPQLRQLLRLGLITMLHRGESLPSPASEAPTAYSPSAESPAAETPTANPRTAKQLDSPGPESPAAEVPAPQPHPSTLTQAVRYGTTPRFLRFFGLTSLDDLPRLATDT
ncbi:MAG: SMC-Scp complex subunit ScpB [Thermogemmata sp.]|nr:SMC-Scp complex subunit ScpB [Thermogemmata fonticola]MCX8141055.1 SMC-Scp complex subunit ScpB [Gemmataceae bacterium]